MTDDIVARLRVLNHHAKKLAENESLHDLHRDALTRCENLTWQAADEIERLRKLSGDAGKLREERDEARREVCELDAEMYFIYRGKPRPVVNTASRMPWDIAIERGWDCYKKEDEQ
jgi:hypothetical protein